MALRTEGAVDGVVRSVRERAHAVARLLEAVGALAVRSRVVLVQRLLQSRARHIQHLGERGDVLGLLAVEVEVHQSDATLEPLQLAGLGLFVRKLLEVLVDDQGRDTVVPFDHRFADLCAIPELVGEPFPLVVDQHALGERIGRVEEPPCGCPVHVIELAADALSESNPHAVVTRRAERQTGHELGHVFGDHLSVEDEPARRQDDAVLGSNAPRSRVLVLDLVALLSYPPRDAGNELADHHL